tara:strand:+ start:194 stop:325 length:132 start_codon:yes stop_codon:yes gene_type:complete
MGAHIKIRKEIIPMRKHRDRHLLFVSLKYKEFASKVILTLFKE